MQGKVFLVTGASGGIGSALAELLADRGAHVVAVARPSERLDALAARHSVVTADVTSPTEVDAAFARALELHGRLDGVAHCVGSVLLKPAHRTTDAEWRHTVATNLDSAFYVLRAATRVMQASGGSIVLVSTAAASIGLANHEAIAAAKAGLEGMGRSAAASYAARGVRVNVVAPGLVRTGLTRAITEHEPSAQASLGMHPLRRFGEPGDVARAIAFFLDPQNDWITGQVLAVDGGLSGVKLPR